MGKKKAAARKPGAGKKTSKHVEVLSHLNRADREAYFENTPVEELLEMWEASYASDLVNMILDLKKSLVKACFEKLIALRRKAVLPAYTLYHYKEYLTNPLPLSIAVESGREIPNYYAILGMPRDATSDELKEAHRLLERAHAPEIFSPPFRKAAEESLKEINEAFSILKNPKKRAQADARLPNISYLYPRRDQSWFEAVKSYAS
jgi:hypothetical protein